MKQPQLLALQIPQVFVSGYIYTLASMYTISVVFYFRQLWGKLNISEGI